MEAACERGGVSNFFDLSPEERGRAYWPNAELSDRRENNP